MRRISIFVVGLGVGAVVGSALGAAGIWAGLGAVVVGIVLWWVGKPVKPAEGLQSRVEKILSLAQQEAATIKADAETEAAAILDRARAQAADPGDH